MDQPTRMGMLRGYPAPALGSRVIVFAIAVGFAIAVQSGAAAVKIRTDFDKTFDFQQAHTWAWSPKGAGDVIVARTPDDDPVAIKQRADPLIKSAVEAEMPRRGLKLSAASPDLVLNYYLLLTLNTSRQTVGQFLPPVAAWGIPPFAPSTQSLEVIPQGALVFDLSTAGRVVWRGIGEAEIKWGLDDAKRTALIREAVQKILASYPPKK